MDGLIVAIPGRLTVEQSGDLTTQKTFGRFALNHQMGRGNVSGKYWIGVDDFLARNEGILVDHKSIFVRSADERQD